MERDTGGFAYPWCGDLNETPTINLGMTLRDWFASQALAGLCAHVEIGQLPPERLASLSYEQSDAMIAERKK